MNLFRNLARRLCGWLSIAYFQVLYWYGGIALVAHRLRFSAEPRQLLVHFGATIGEGTLVYPGIVIHGAARDFSNLRIGRHCRILRDCIIDLTQPVELADYCGVGFRNNLFTHLRLLPDSPLRNTILREAEAPIRFETGAATFADVTILHGVTLGRCSIVSAGAVVGRSTPAYSTTWGNPARTVRLRPPSGVAAPGGAAATELQSQIDPPPSSHP